MMKCANRSPTEECGAPLTHGEGPGGGTHTRGGNHNRRGCILAAFTCSCESAKRTPALCVRETVTPEPKEPQVRDEPLGS